MQAYQTTLDVSPETTVPSTAVYGKKNVGKSILKGIAVAGACAACVCLGVKMERDGHAQNVESMFATSVMARAPVISATAGKSLGRTGKSASTYRAFQQPKQPRSIRMSAEGGEAAPATTESEKDATPATPPAPKVPVVSEAIPFINAPAYLDGTMVGDRGLDPFGFGADGKLERMREAEIKHGRLAMLAAAGWPISEKLDPVLAKLVNLPVGLNADGTAPSPFDGGLDSISTYYWGAVLGASVAIEFAGRDNKAPGDYGFDPLEFMKDKGAEEKKTMAEKEMKNGRLAMMAIAGFAVQEALYHTPVTQETPAFFQPIWETLG